MFNFFKTQIISAEDAKYLSFIHESEKDYKLKLIDKELDSKVLKIKNKCIKEISKQIKIYAKNGEYSITLIPNDLPWIDSIFTEHYEILINSLDRTFTEKGFTFKYNKHTYGKFNQFKDKIIIDWRH